MAKKKVKTSPPSWARGALQETLNDTRSILSDNQPRLQRISSDLYGAFGNIAPRAFGSNPNQDLADRFIGQHLSGSMLSGNPYLESVLARTSDDVTDRVGAQFSRAGMFGGSAHQGVLARELARAQNEARLQNYDMERGRQFQALAALGPTEAARYTGVSPALSLATGAATLPYAGVDAASGVMRNLIGGYGVQKQTGGALGMLPGLISSLGEVGSAVFSDPVIKADARLLGVRPDGLGVYRYRNRLTGDVEQGVMADEVEAARPDALGPTVGGLRTVDYGALGEEPPLSAAMAPPAAVAAASPQPEPERRGGFAGFVDRLIDPDPNTTSGKVGLLFRALGRATGSPLSMALSDIQDQRRQEAEARRKAELEAEDRDFRRAELGYKLGLLDAQLNPPPPEFVRTADALGLPREEAAKLWRLRMAGRYSDEAVDADVVRNKALQEMRKASQMELIRAREASQARLAERRAALSQRAAGRAEPAASVANLPRPASKAERDALPAGTRYIAPDGRVRVRGAE